MRQKPELKPFFGGSGGNINVCELHETERAKPVAT